MGDLTKNFSECEFVCKCCGRLVLSSKLTAALQQLRDLIGEPIIVNCGYRCRKHNREVGGVPNSYHTKGMAADIRCDGLTPQELKKFAEAIPAFNQGGIGLYTTFVHVDVRGHAARWRG